MMGSCFPSKGLSDAPIRPGQSRNPSCSPAEAGAIALDTGQRVGEWSG
jgi:hypothetical protein